MTLAYPLHATLTGPKVPLSPFLALDGTVTPSPHFPVIVILTRPKLGDGQTGAPIPINLKLFGEIFA